LTGEESEQFVDIEQLDDLPGVDENALLRRVQPLVSLIEAFEEGFGPKPRWTFLVLLTISLLN